MNGTADERLTPTKVHRQSGDSGISHDGDFIHSTEHPSSSSSKGDEVFVSSSSPGQSSQQSSVPYTATSSQSESSSGPVAPPPSVSEQSSKSSNSQRYDCTNDESSLSLVYSQSERLPAKPEKSLKRVSSLTSNSAMVDSLMKRHLEQDKNWKPSGHHKTRRKCGTQFEEDMRNDWKEDARKLLELFLQKSLAEASQNQGSASSSLPPISETYSHANVTGSATSESLASGSVFTHTPISPIDTSQPSIRSFKFSPSALGLLELDESQEPENMAKPVLLKRENGEEKSGLQANRMSYYDAVNIVDDVDGQTLTTASLATGEDDDELDGGDNCTDLVESLTKEALQKDAVQLRAGQSGSYHIYQKAFSERPISSDSSLSLPNSDDGQRDGHQVRKKKKLSIAQRLKNAFNIDRRKSLVERSDSRSEAENTKYAIQTNKVKKRKKRKKMFATTSDETLIASATHTHHIDFHGSVSVDQAGLNQTLLGESESDSQTEIYRHGIAGRFQADKIRARISKKNKNMDKKELERKVLEEMLKKSKEKEARKLERNQSTHSGDSNIFKQFSLRRNVQAPSPSASSPMRSLSMSIPFLRRKKTSPSKCDQSKQSESSVKPSQKGTRPKTTIERGMRSTDSLDLPPTIDTKSRSAEILSVRPTATTHLQPQHSRSRSAQDYSLEGQDGEGFTPLTPSMNFTPDPHPLQRPPSGAPRDALTLPLNVKADVTIQTKLVCRAVNDSTDSADHGNPLPPGSGLQSAGASTSLFLKTEARIEEDMMVGNAAERQTEAESSTSSELERMMAAGVDIRDRTEKEKDKIYEHIVNKLAQIARSMEKPSDGESSDLSTPLDELILSDSLKAKGLPPMITGSLPARDERPDTAEAEPENRKEAAIDELSKILREEADKFSLSNPALNQRSLFGSSSLLLGANMADYNTFSLAADKLVATNDSHIQSIALLFSFTSLVVKAVGYGGTAAKSVVNNTLTYTENRFARYIMDNGGWDSVIEESDLD